MNRLSPLLFSALVSIVFPAFGKPNVLIVTVDDMSCDSVGAFGCKLAGTTPQIDRFAAESLIFPDAHTQVGNCQPSRNVLFSGRYPHRSGVEGFYQVRPIDYPVMCDVMRSAGYFTGIRGKVSHSTPHHPYAWDADLTKLPDGKEAHGKDVASYHTSTRTGIAAAKAAGKPFFLNINISDPHTPFWKSGDAHPTSLEFSNAEVPVPGFLPDLPAVRADLALYYSSVRRADDCFGAILRALEESGEKENTVIIFLSDHGMPLPFAKTQLYHHSTRTPLIIRWPGVTKPGAADRWHLVSAVDVLPTVCDIVGAEKPAGMDGRSFAEVLRGGILTDREHIFKEYNENAGGFRNPMRAVQTKFYLYIFNPWSDGNRTMATATNGMASWRAMKSLATSDPAVAARVELMEHRVVEELYYVEDDPDCLTNLISDPAHAEALAEMRGALEEWMVETGDHALEAFQGRDDPAIREAYMAKVTAESEARKSKRPAKKGKRNAGREAPAERE
jgi:N-sulfoglucosamine sulfohydrolase